MPPKYGSFRQFYLISFPAGFSFKDFIATDNCSLNYAPFEAILDIRVGNGDFSNTFGYLKSTFRILPIEAYDINILEFKVRVKFVFMCMCLPFECAIRCVKFEIFSVL